MNNTIRNYFRAGYAGLFLQSYEEGRVEAELKAIADSIEFKLYNWDIKNGLTGPVPSSPDEQLHAFSDTQDPLTLLEQVNKLPERSVVLAKDFHLFVAEANPMMIRAVKEMLNVARTNLRRFVILGCAFKLCPELEKEFTAVDFALPSREELKGVIGTIAQSAGILINGNGDAIYDAASGMTTTEAADAAALAVIESDSKEISPVVVAREKAGVVKKNGLLEIIPPTVGLDDIGGLEYLKADLYEKRNLFSRAAKSYGLPSPRPILCVGQSGTGKSLTATACGKIFGVPTLRLEAGKLFGSLVGESERNWRSCFATAKAIAPCILWCDEIDGLLSGAQSSGQTDGGTTARVIKAILQDLQYSADGIFFFSTANDVDNLPDPFIDRCDVWFVDLPTQSEREAIWKIHIAKRGRKPDDYSIPLLAKLTEGFSGRQIEQLWIKSLILAFNDSGREPTNEDVNVASERFVPTSKTMAKVIEARRARLQNRAMPASKPDVREQSSHRKLA